MVSNSYTSTTENIENDKPAWANACKIYIKTAKGTGVSAMSHAADTENDDRDRHHNHNRNDNRNHGDRHDNRNVFDNNENEDHHVHHNISAVSYNAAAGGDGLIYTTKKALKIVDGDTNYTISATFESSNTTLEIKHGNTVQANVTITNGTNASQNPFTITHHDDNNLVNNNHYDQWVNQGIGIGYNNYGEHGRSSLAQLVGMPNEHGNSEDANINNNRNNTHNFYKGNFKTHAEYDANERLHFPPGTHHYQQYFPYNFHHRNNNFRAGAHGTAGVAAAVYATTTWDNGSGATNTYTEQTTSNTGTTSNIEVYWFKV